MIQDNNSTVRAVLYKVEISTRRKSLAVGQAYMAIIILNYRIM